MKKPQKFVPVVAVLNMKGGVGKTTICANVSLAVFEIHNNRTLLLDLDPQFNLTQGLLRREAYDKLKSNGKTIFGAMDPPSDVGLFDVATSSQPPPKAKDINEGLYYLTDKPSVELAWPATGLDDTRLS
jgi:chromosome partitioning protein